MTKRKKPRGRQPRASSVRGREVYSWWLREFVAQSDDPLVCDSEETLRALLLLASKGLPSEYGWRLTSVEAFVQQGEEIQRRMDGGEDDADDLNRHYWHDAARSIEAYGVLSVWRGAELLEVALESLNAKQVLPPAVLARALLELAGSFIYVANIVEKIIDESLKAPTGAVVINQELEEVLLKALWGTRLGEPPDHLKQVNVLTRIQKLSSHPNAGLLLPTYEYLCEVAHPNVIGNMRFQATGSEARSDGSMVVRVARDAEFLASAEIREKTVWALCWSAFCLGSGQDMLQRALARLLTRWPLSD